MSHRSFEELTEDYIQNRLTGEVLQRFLEMTGQEPYKQQLKDYIGRLLHNHPGGRPADSRRADILLQNILAAARATGETLPAIPPPGPRSIRKTGLIKAVAAVLLAAVSIPAVWLLAHRHSHPAPVVVQVQKMPVQDRLPGTQKALLTLGDGTVITLDDAANGTLAKQGAATVIKLTGKLNYKATSTGTRETVYNTIATPRGGQYQIELPDGSLVWLNAASSIHFPTAFTGPERRVDITGEAYFEIAKMNRPFIVAVNGSQVTVTGTHFDVMAYPDEAELQTTLLEGSVLFSHNDQSVVLTPLEQLSLKRDGRLHKSLDPDAEDVLAWKNGQFLFDNADIQTIMRQLVRWYDVEVEYRVTPDNNLYHVEMPRSSKLSSVLKVLEITANVHCSIEGNKIIVS